TIGDAAEADDVGAASAGSDVRHSVADHGNGAVALGELPAHHGLAVGAGKRRALVEPLIAATRIELYRHGVDVGHGYRQRLGEIPDRREQAAAHPAERPAGPTP